MTTITADNLISLGTSLPHTRAVLYAGVLNAALAAVGVDTPCRIRHFIAQAATETGGFRSLVESTSYRSPERLDALFTNVQGVEHARRLIAAGAEAIGNAIYANKNGNGGVASGDGYRFRGRGFLQVTGRANYRRVGAVTRMPLEEQPDLLGEAEPAARAAAAYWQQRNINAAADAGDVAAVTRLVNGPACLHLDERRKWLKAAARVWMD